MNELDEITDFFNKQRERVDCFTPFHIPEFITPELDIELNPEHFTKWLQAEAKDTDYDASRSYAENVASMCEYSCLYAAMMLHDKNLKGELTIISGNYGWWEHYWLKYTVNGVEYYLDLTLQQFIEDAPKLSITEAKQNPKGYNYDEEFPGECIKEYVNRKMGFDFYANPKEL